MRDRTGHIKSFFMNWLETRQVQNQDIFLEALNVSKQRDQKYMKAYLVFCVNRGASYLKLQKRNDLPVQ